MKTFAAIIAFLISGLFFAVVVIGIGITFYVRGIDGAIREIFGTREDIEWISIGMLFAYPIAGLLFLAIGLSLLSRKCTPDGRLNGSGDA